MDEKIILGIDEVGRGPWAGPLVVGAVVLGGDEQDYWESLTDSKKLSAAKRISLNQIILEKAEATGLGWVTAAELDKYGLSAALKLATRRAVKPILTAKVRFDEIVIDGTVNFLQNTPLEDYVTTLKKADLLVKAVSAASIIAKVARDDYMIQLAEKYPAYGFETHVGYGTARHKQALLEHGICPEHRQSFRPVKEIATTGKQVIQTREELVRKTPTAGQKAEQQVAEYLQARQHQIVARNFKTRFYEIDIISTCGQNIYFTEVKYSRHASVEGSALRRIDQHKLQQLQLAAKDYYKNYPQFQSLQPVLAASSVSGGDFIVDNWLELEWND